MIRRSLLAGAAASLLTLSLAACGSSTTDRPASGNAPAGTTALTLTDGWCKAVDVPAAGDMHSASPSASVGMDHDMAMPMTACFGILKNATTADVTLTEARVDTGVAGRTELHETVRGSDGTLKMQQKQGGFTIPAGQSVELKPGGNHVMLLDLKRSLTVGSTLTVTLTSTAGASTTVDLPVKAFTGAQESYVPSASPSK